MTARAEQRVSHRRKVSKRRALIAGASALGLTGAAIVTTTLMSTAGAAASWPTPNGSKPVSKTIPVSGTYDGKLAKFYGTGDRGRRDLQGQVVLGRVHGVRRRRQERRRQGAAVQRRG